MKSYHAQGMTRLRLEQLIWLVFPTTLFFSSCDDDQDQNQECEPAYVEYAAVAGDSLCFGSWEWVYTLKHVIPLSGNSYVSDTIYPGDSVPGFETLHFVSGTVDNSRIRFDVSGSTQDGCYEYWNSVKYPAPYPRISAYFANWSGSEKGSLGLEVQLYGWIENRPIAKIGGLEMYRIEDQNQAGLFYRNWFVKVE
jgi:hypothetical protein